MRVHRFYVEGMSNKWGPVELKSTIWLHDSELLGQWLKAFRFRVGQEIVLFNDDTERLYRITEIESASSVHVELITVLERSIPKAHIYLCWSLLKKDKNEWIVQKATELGVRNLVPIIAERSEKLGFDVQRMHKIAVEAAEQCGRSDIPVIREPVSLDSVIRDYAHFPLFVAAQGGEHICVTSQMTEWGVLIGPEGGWSVAELDLCDSAGVRRVGIADFTLRAETAAIVAVARIMPA